jgi:hypothetical protein
MVVRNLRPAASQKAGQGRAGRPPAGPQGSGARLLPGGPPGTAPPHEAPTIPRVVQRTTGRPGDGTQPTRPLPNGASPAAPRWLAPSWCSRIALRSLPLPLRLVPLLFFRAVVIVLLLLLLRLPLMLLKSQLQLDHAAEALLGPRPALRLQRQRPSAGPGRRLAPSHLHNGIAVVAVVAVVAVAAIAAAPAAIAAAAASAGSQTPGALPAERLAVAPSLGPRGTAPSGSAAATARRRRPLRGCAATAAAAGSSSSSHGL